MADLKTRQSRFARVHAEARAGAGELLYMSEYMHPRLEELCDTLPASIGGWIERTGWVRTLLSPLFRGGRRIPTAKLTGFLVLQAMAGLRPIRRASLRHSRETAAFTGWLARMLRAADADYDLAVEVALCQTLVKGYSDTHARGMRSFNAVMAEVDAGRADAARVRRLRKAALADEAGAALAAELAAPAAPP